MTPDTVPDFPGRGDYVVVAACGTRGLIVGSHGCGPDIRHRVDFLDGTAPRWFRRDELTWRGGIPCAPARA